MPRLLLLLGLTAATEIVFGPNQLLSAEARAGKSNINDDLVKMSPIFQKVSHECVRVMLSKLRSEVCLAKETLLARLPPLSGLHTHAFSFTFTGARQRGARARC